MSNVLTLVRGTPKGPTIHQSVIEDLEMLLELARTGELDGFAATYTKSDSTVATIISTPDKKFDIGHGISALQYRFHMTCHENAING